METIILPLFYHMIDIAAVNAFILYNLIATSSGVKTITENQFRDNLVLQLLPNMERMRGKKQPVPLVVQVDLIAE